MRQPLPNSDCSPSHQLKTSYFSADDENCEQLSYQIDSIQPRMQATFTWSKRTTSSRSVRQQCLKSICGFHGINQMVEVEKYSCADNTTTNLFIYLFFSVTKHYIWCQNDYVNSDFFCLYMYMTPEIGTKLLRF